VVVAVEREPVRPELGHEVGRLVTDDDAEVADAEALADLLLEDDALELVGSPAHARESVGSRRTVVARSTRVRGSDDATAVWAVHMQLRARRGRCAGSGRSRVRSRRSCRGTT